MRLASADMRFSVVCIAFTRVMLLALYPCCCSWQVINCISNFALSLLSCPFSVPSLQYAVWITQIRLNEVKAVFAATVQYVRMHEACSQDFKSKDREI